MLDRKKRILICEDSEIFADMTREFLEGEGYEVKRSENGFECVKEVYNFLPHLIVSDVEMPICKGYHAARLLKSRPLTAKIPFILLTAMNETRDRFKGIDAGVDSYIEKAPENFAFLLSEIKQLLERSGDINFEAIKKESARINDQTIIEDINNLLDDRLVLTTLLGKLSAASDLIESLEDTVSAIIGLISVLCETQIVEIFIVGGDAIYSYRANRAGFTEEIVSDFTAMVKADFNNAFPDAAGLPSEDVELCAAGANKKRLQSSLAVKLNNAGKPFALICIANTMNEYFSQPIAESLKLFLNSSAPIIANALSLRRIQTVQKRTRQAFSRYVPIDVIDEIIESGGNLPSVGESRKIAVLFCDIRSFTNIGENTNARDLVAFLNNYFFRVGSSIVEYGGQINKYMGDGLMAIFGAPRTLPNAGESAVKSAISIISTLDKIDTNAINLKNTRLSVGIGINFGECVVGNIGFADKQEYTVIGDNVNIASRLEGLTKAYRHPIIVSETIYAVAKNSFIFRKIDSVRVVGKQKSVGVYALYVDYDEDAGAIAAPQSLLISRRMLDLCDKAQRLIEIREFVLAKDLLEEALKIDPYDRICKVHLDRVNEFIKTPPDNDWDGTVTMTNK
ncbi:hypothetical protein FACS189487_02190 [Campylobacterota bacterium]|nr:hypothetical protein FACS189487_02190 [Campylobacterota bacterium]